MKRLILPLVIALLAGIGGGSGFSYVRAKKTAAIEKLHADSVKAVEKAKEAKTHASTAAKHDTLASVPVVPVTPADSIRAEQSRRNALPPSATTAAAKDSAPGTKPHATPAAAPMPAKGTVPSAPTASTTGAKPIPPTTTASATPNKTPGATPNATPSASPSVPSTASPPPSVVRIGTTPAIDSALPEKRLAKIFGAMQAKEAGKVLEQMNDSDVRTILGMMSDRQAAAILGTFPAARAAGITKGVSKLPGGTK